ncbi:MAG: methionine synthase [Planctomycetes bacterium]|nr:methionine synthase [Planctomycetota bacterium]
MTRKVLPWLDAVRAEALHALAAQRIIVFDGAMGTQLQARNLTAADFGGPDLEGCNENLVLTRPDVIRSIHEAYFNAGADVVETDSFGGTAIVLAEYGLESKVQELNSAAARIAREAAAAMSTPHRMRFVAGSMGPTTKAISVTGGVTFAQLVENFREQARGLVAGGADLLLVETQQDTRNVKAALLGIHDLFDEIGARVPVMVSCTIEPMGTMLAGQGVEAFWTSISHFDLFSVGMNCATGPEFMTDHLRSLSDLARHRVSVMANAGLPDENGLYGLTPAGMAAAVTRFAEHGWINVAGGCCGTGPEHVKAIVQAIEGRRPRAIPDHRRTLLSGIDFLEVTDEMRPVIVGERTNVIGSRKFKRLITDEKFEEAAEIGRAQVRGGAHLVDVCTANPDRDEMRDIDRLLTHLVKMVKAPLVIDSTDASVIEHALTWCQGKALINSVNLEDGEERFETVVPLALRYGAALVVGCIDEDPLQGMGVTRQRKLEIARRSHEILTTRFGVREEDIVFDPLVFPCATGSADYVGSAVETIEGVRLIKHAFPRCRTLLGVSNVSFGLPEAGREVLNAVFLYHNVQAGLDLAIVNSEGLERYASIPDDERRLAEDLLWNRGDDPVAAFAAHFRGRAAKAPKDRSTLPLDERISRCIVEGTKEGLAEDLATKLKEALPLEIINGPLMSGMDEVGRLFNRNELIVAEVLQSAEAMKAAVSFLEPFMDKLSSSTKGTIVLGTVKGDVHDIGKNLVDIILSNNGWKVINLGIKVEPQKFVAAARLHKPDAIGLSGLLVKSAQQMIATAEDLRAAGIDAPMLVGGAALSRNFTVNRIAPAYGSLVLYARDAMDGLALIERIRKPDERSALLTLASKTDEKAAPVTELKVASEAAAVRSREVPIDIEIPSVPDLVEHRERWTNLDDVWEWINPAMLFGRHMGLRDAKRKLDEGDEKAEKVRASVDEVKAMARSGVGLPSGFAFEGMRVDAVWRFFRAVSEGNRVVLFHEDGREAARFDFPRQRKEDGLCLADYVLPPQGDRFDHVAAFVTTAGAGIRDLSARLKDDGRFVACHALQALAVESAEAAAEVLHARIRALWGFADAQDTSMMDRYQAKYRGKRYSFGYPACPDLEMQDPLFRVLDAASIGVQLTDGHMMDPEASVSALVFHHPAARYFAV